MPANLVFTSHRLVFAVAGLLACLAASPSAAQSVSWPAFGRERSLPRLDGLTDALPDFVGPLDGSAELTIFTEGNHYPVLLPLVLDAFPAWCKDSGACEADAACHAKFPGVRKDFEAVMAGCADPRAGRLAALRRRTRLALWRCRQRLRSRPARDPGKLFCLPELGDRSVNGAAERGAVAGRCARCVSGRAFTRRAVCLARMVPRGPRALTRPARLP